MREALARDHQRGATQFTSRAVGDALDLGKGGEHVHAAIRPHLDMVAVRVCVCEEDSVMVVMVVCASYGEQALVHACHAKVLLVQWVGACDNHGNVVAPRADILRRDAHHHLASPIIHHWVRVELLRHIRQSTAEPKGVPGEVMVCVCVCQGSLCRSRQASAGLGAANTYCSTVPPYRSPYMVTGWWGGPARGSSVHA